MQGSHKNISTKQILKKIQSSFFFLLKQTCPVLSFLYCTFYSLILDNSYYFFLQIQFFSFFMKWLFFLFDNLKANVSTTLIKTFPDFPMKFTTAVHTGLFPGGSDGKAFAYNVGDLGSIPGLERSPGEGNVTHSSTLAWNIVLI